MIQNQEPYVVVCAENEVLLFNMVLLTLRPNLVFVQKPEEGAEKVGLAAALGRRS